MRKNVLLTGGTGFIGRYLADVLITNDFSISILSRSERQNTIDISYYVWDIEKGNIDEDAILKADYIIHLAGEGIADERWTAQRKEAIINSREKSIQMIYGVLKKHNKKLDAFITASGVGIYGARNGEEICIETTAVDNDFLGTTCQKWEVAADRVESLGIRTVKIRTGLVLGNGEGFLKRLVPIFKFKLGSAIGSGKQYMPWIHIDDLCAIYLFAINTTSLSGAFNAAINDNTNNTSFSKALAKFYNYSIWLPNVPSFLIKLALGEMAVLILTGLRVSSDKIESMGFKFKYKTLEEALRQCLV